MELALEAPQKNQSWIVDVETTGLGEHHRIIEIAGVEIIDRRLTGRTFQYYINPQRHVDPEAIKIHGLTDAFLADKPVFADVIGDVLDVIKGSILVAHNANFDVGFINRELNSCGRKSLSSCIEGVVDTLVLARNRFPGKKNNLDMLCKRFKIDISDRTLHGALLDCQLLSQVFLLLTQSQGAIALKLIEETVEAVFEPDKHPPLVVLQASSEQVAEHDKWIAKLAESCEDGAADWG